MVKNLIILRKIPPLPQILRKGGDAVSSRRERGVSTGKKKRLRPFVLANASELEIVFWLVASSEFGKHPRSMSTKTESEEG